MSRDDDAALTRFALLDGFSGAGARPGSSTALWGSSERAARAPSRWLPSRGRSKTRSSALASCSWG